MVQTQRGEGGRDGSTEEDGGVFLDSSAFGQKESNYVHKNILTPRDSLGSMASDHSSISSVQEDLLFDQKDDSSDSAFEQENYNNNNNNNIDDCAYDQTFLEFEKLHLNGGPINNNYSSCETTDTSIYNLAASSTSWQSGPMTSSDLKLPAKTPESYIAFGKFKSYFGQPDLNSNTKDAQDFSLPKSTKIQGFDLTESSARPEFGPCDSLYCGGEWIRPMGKFEVLMATGGYYGTLNTIQALRIVSTQPIRPDVVRHAVTTLARRTELLQVSVARRGLWLWFRRMHYVSVPFRVDSQTEDVMPTYYDLLHKPYDMARGPLWRARLVPVSQNSQGVHRAVLMFTIHHCITDAFTNMLLCRETLKILNASMSGRVYLPELRPVLPAIGDELVTSSDMLYAAKFAAYKFYSSTVGNFNKSVYFNGAFPQPITTKASTQVLYDELTEDATRRLLKCCKAAGATVHATIMTLAKLAMISVANERSGGQEADATIRVFNCVNMRRYFPEAHRNSAGCYISIEEQEVEVGTLDASSPEKLWSLVNRVHESLHRSLKKGMPVKNQPGLLPCAILIPVNYALTSMGRLNINDNHIVSTNMGDLHDLLPAQCGEGPVRITHLLRCVSDQFTGHPYTIIFHTFLGRFSFGLEYYTNKTDSGLARQLFTVLSNYISDVATHGAIRTGEVDRSADFNRDKF